MRAAKYIVWGALLLLLMALYIEYQCYTDINCLTAYSYCDIDSVSSIGEINDINEECKKYNVSCIFYNIRYSNFNEAYISYLSEEEVAEQLGKEEGRTSRSSILSGEEYIDWSFLGGDVEHSYSRVYLIGEEEEIWRQIIGNIIWDGIANILDWLQEISERR